MKDKIKKRINALLAKTKDNGCTEQEAMAAIMKAKQMMTDYFINDADLVDKEECVLDSVDYVQGYWLFISDLGKVFDCKVYKNKKQYFFFGFKSDVDMCLYFYSYIIRSCRAAVAQYKKTDEFLEKRQYTSSKRLTGTFRNGFLHSIASKLSAMYAERKNGLKIGHGIVLLEKEKEVEQEFDKLGIKLHIKKRKFSSGDSFDSGKSKGDNFNINQGVNSKNGTLGLN